MPEIIEDGENDLPGSFWLLIQRLVDHLKELDRQVGELEAEIQRWYRENAPCQKLAKIPGIGPMTASAMSASIGDAKNLSVNIVYLEMHFSERDDAGCEMVEREEAALEFLVAHQQLAKPVEPTMADLNNPTAGFLSGMPLFCLLLLRAAGHMRDVAMTLNDLQRWLSAISGIQAQVLGATFGRHLALDHDGRQDCVELRNVMPIRSGHDERQGDATAVDQQVTLAPIFSPDQSGWARPALVPVEP